MRRPVRTSSWSSTSRIEVTVSPSGCGHGRGTRPRGAGPSRDSRPGDDGVAKARQAATGTDHDGSGQTRPSSATSTSSACARKRRHASRGSGGVPGDVDDRLADDAEGESGGGPGAWSGTVSTSRSTPTRRPTEAMRERSRGCSLGSMASRPSGDGEARTAVSTIVRSAGPGSESERWCRRPAGRPRSWRAPRCRAARLASAWRSWAGARAYGGAAPGRELADHDLGATEPLLPPGGDPPDGDRPDGQDHDDPGGVAGVASSARPETASIASAPTSASASRDHHQRRHQAPTL